MRKLRRLPWRIPKSHRAEQPAAEVAKPTADVELELEIAREREREREREMQPLAFVGGRYVYGACAAPVRNTEIRRKARHRVMPATAPVVG